MWHLNPVFLSKKVISIVLKWTEVLVSHIHLESSEPKMELSQTYADCQGGNFWVLTQICSVLSALLQESVDLVNDLGPLGTHKPEIGYLGP